MIYLDNNATTPLDPDVLEAMLPYYTNIQANASSRHSAGGAAKEAVEEARKAVSDLLGAKPRDIVFTSGATESINTAIKGVAFSHQAKGRHIITCQTEHSACLETCKYLESIGFEVTYVAVDANGTIDLDELKDALRADTMLVSVMLVNSETGVIQPLEEIASLAHEVEAVFFSDLTQAAGKIPIQVEDLGVDVAAFSAHKFHGPKGVGALYCRSSKLISPFIHGGGQERGLRSGTYNVPGIVGFGAAASISIDRMLTDRQHLRELQTELELALSEIPNVKILGHSSRRIHTTTSVCCSGYPADVLIPALGPIIVSNGSACSSENITPSHVLKTMGLSDEEAFSTIRVSYGRFNTAADIHKFVLALNGILKKSNVAISE